MKIISLKTTLFKLSDSLFDFFDREIKQLDSGDIIVITSKIVALSQDRVGKLENKKRLISRESKQTIDTPWATLTLTADDGWCLNAGIDESNANGQLILLPVKPFVMARQIRHYLLKKFSLGRLGVIISDTKSLPLRAGTMGRALSYAGFKPLKSYIGKKDLFGRTSRLTESNMADALAASAVLLMGEGNEQTPLALIKGAPVEFTNKNIARLKNKSLSLPPEKDIFAKVFRQRSRSARNRKLVK